MLADAAHNLTAAAAVIISLIAVRLTRRPPTPRRSYGYHRTTILAALANALGILLITVFIAYEAINRLRNPEPVHGGIVVAVALVAMLINLGAAAILYERQVDLNMRSAFLHMAGDAVASLGVAVAGLVILVTGRFEWLDPLVSLGIGALIGVEAWRLVRSSVDVLLESTPDDIDLDALTAAITNVDGVVDVHDLHVWSLSSGIRALSAHLLVTGTPLLDEAEAVGAQVKQRVADRFAIAHSTLELEAANGRDKSDCIPDTERHVAD